MEIYQTENQQVAAIREFFQKNTKLILLVTLLVVLFFVGINYWKNRGFARAAVASDVYQEMLVADIAQDENTVLAKGQFLSENYASSPYAQFGNLLLAKNAVKNNDLAKAEEYLRWIVKQDSAQKVVGPVARARLARILLAKGEYENALKLVKDPKEAYTVLFGEVEGDIHIAQGNIEAAKKAYLTALYHVPPGAQAPLLQLKLIDLGVREDEMHAPRGEDHA